MLPKIILMTLPLLHFYTALVPPLKHSNNLVKRMEAVEISETATPRIDKIQESLECEAQISGISNLENIKKGSLEDYKLDKNQSLDQCNQKLVKVYSELQKYIRREVLSIWWAQKKFPRTEFTPNDGLKVFFSLHMKNIEQRIFDLFLQFIGYYKDGESLSAELHASKSGILLDVKNPSVQEDLNINRNLEEFNLIREKFRQLSKKQHIIVRYAQKHYLKKMFSFGYGKAVVP